MNSQVPYKMLASSSAAASLATSQEGINSMKLVSYHLYKYKEKRQDYYE
jgi:hypothetical protein